jgi:hypothetical protein
MKTASLRRLAAVDSPPPQSFFVIASFYRVARALIPFLGYQVMTL